MLGVGVGFGLRLWRRFCNRLCRRFRCGGLVLHNTHVEWRELVLFGILPIGQFALIGLLIRRDNGAHGIHLRTDLGVGAVGQSLDGLGRQYRHDVCGIVRDFAGGDFRHGGAVVRSAGFGFVHRKLFRCRLGFHLR